MSGLKSRRKGMRVEYLIRDAFRLAGFEVDRVPASGAAQGFKGDLHIKRPDNSVLIVEVKARKSAFKKLYKLLDTVSLWDIRTPDAVISTMASFSVDLNWVNGEYVVHADFDLAPYKKLAAGADILVVKADNQRPIYIRWLT